MKTQEPHEGRIAAATGGQESGSPGTKPDESKEKTGSGGADGVPRNPRTDQAPPHQEGVPRNPRT